MSCATPLEQPSRHALDGVDEVHLGRAAARAAVRRDEDGLRRLIVALADPRISSAHARLIRCDESWMLEDLSSKNGTFVNGTPANATTLEDGDCLQIGQTLLLFRDALPTPVDTPSDLEATGRVPALATLIPLLTRRFDALATVAARNVPILLVSETGTGKEVIAHAVHALSRRTGEFVPVNCGGLPPTLVESVLFGHRRGAFSGAVGDHPGLFCAASGGTLLLDEVGDMPLPIQSAVLRALQDGEVLSVGATKAVRVDARVIAATHHDLDEGVAQGTFREDLLARLSGFMFRLPPLRDRREDIGLLVGVLLRRLMAERGSAPTLSPEVGLALLRHAWPQNVRELEKCLAHAVALAGDGRIELEHLPESTRAGVRSQVRTPDDELRSKLIAALTKGRGNVSFAADSMRTSRSQVHRWMKRFGIEPAAFRR